MIWRGSSLALSPLRQYLPERETKSINDNAKQRCQVLSEHLQTPRVGPVRQLLIAATWENKWGKRITWTRRLGQQIAAAAAKSLQSCPNLCDPIDSSPPGSPVPGILQARTLEWVAISFSNALKWKVKGKSVSKCLTSWPHGLQPTRPLRPWDFPGKSTGVGCHCLLWNVY